MELLIIFQLHMEFLSAQFLLQVICDMMRVTGACELVVKCVRLYTILFPLLAYSAEFKLSSVSCRI